jgi:hypothetical protein
MSDINRYYLVNIIDDYYAMEFRTSVLVRATDETLEAKLKDLCSTWYSEDDPISEEIEGTYEQPNGCLTYIDTSKEITEATFNDLIPILGAF